MSQNYLMEISNKNLSKEEQEAFMEFLNSGLKSIDVYDSLKLYDQFLTGASCKDIAHTNKKMTLGAVIDARIKHKWDDRREEYLTSLYKYANDRAIQVQLEAVNYVADMLSVTHKLHGEKYKEFMKSGDASKIEGLEIGSLKQYKEAVDLLMKLTGQDNKKQIVQKVTIEERETSKRTPDINVTDLLKSLDK